MEKVLIAGAAVRTEGKGGGEKVEDKEEKKKTHFDPRFGKGVHQSHFHNSKVHSMSLVTKSNSQISNTLFHFLESRCLA